MHSAAAPANWRRDGTAIVADRPDGGRQLGRRPGDARPHPWPPPLPGQVTVGGEAAQSADFLDLRLRQLPVYVLALIALLTFVLLARAFRSLILPLKAVLLNLLSVVAAWGLIVLVWQKGFGSDAIWGIEATQAINVEMPIVVFAFLFGISMDYQVFIISRMREAYDRTGSTETADRRGHRPHRSPRHQRRADPRPRVRCLRRFSPGTEAKIFALALGGGILIDATIIRGVLAPAAVAILGRWNWWLPDWAARILRVDPSPLEPETPGRQARSRYHRRRRSRSDEGLHRRSLREARAVHGAARARARLRGGRRVPRGERREARCVQGAHHGRSGSDGRPRVSRAVAGCDGVLVVLVPRGVHGYSPARPRRCWTTRLRGRVSCFPRGGTSPATVRTCIPGSSRRS